jgi:hypothetical protein
MRAVSFRLGADSGWGTVSAEPRDLSDRAQLDAEIREFQAAHSGMSYADAWGEVRKRHSAHR